MTELLDMMDLHHDASLSFARHLEGSAHNYSYFECENLNNIFFNYLFANDPLTDEIIEQYSQRLITAGKKPAFQMVAGQDNEKICIEKGYSCLNSSVWMKAELTHEPNVFLIDGYRIDTQSIPFSEDFLTVFAEAFLDNDGIGYSLENNSITAYRKIRAHDDFQENVFIGYEDSVPSSIAQITSDSNTKKGLLYNVGTNINFRRKGHSRAVCSLALHEAWSEGITTVYLGTEENSPMEEFYSSLGFSTFGTTRIYCTQG